MSLQRVHDVTWIGRTVMVAENGEFARRRLQFAEDLGARAGVFGKPVRGAAMVVPHRHGNEITGKYNQVRM